MKFYQDFEVCLIGDPPLNQDLVISIQQKLQTQLVARNEYAFHL